MPRLILLVAGSLGLAVVARAAAMYRGTDPLAFALVLAIGAGLLLGLGELWGRAMRADRLRRDLRALPNPATIEAIESAKEPLRALLHARTAGSPLLPQGASLATYLLGMLVMLGMLGTFLGLFESLRGARVALTAGGDVDALRSGLAAPMVGLSRAFGTSATGVSASALLGLAMVFTRREEARFAKELSSYASGPLLPLTMQGRMLAALEAVATSTTQLPTTSTAMQAALSQVSKLEAEMARERKESAKHLEELTRSLMTELRSSLLGITQEIRASFDATGAKTSAALESLVEKTAGVLHETSREQLQASRKMLEESASSLRASSEEAKTTLMAAQAETLASLRTVGAEVTSALRELGQGTSASLRELSQETSASLRTLGQETSASLRELSETTSTTLRSGSDDASAALRALSEEAVSALRALGQETSASLGAATTEAASALRAAGEETSAALRTLSAESASALRETSLEQAEATRLSLEKAATAMQASAERAEEAQVRASSELSVVLEKTAGEASASMREAAEAVRRELAEAIERAGKEAVLAIGPIAEQATSRAGEVALTHLSQWLEVLSRDAEERKQGEREVGERLASIAAAVEGSVRELASLTETQSSRLGVLADEVREQAKAVSKASEERITEAALQAQLVLEQQAAAHVAFHEKLEAVRAELGGALVSKIEEHASELREATAQTATLAREAAELLRLGSAEISAAAELLTGAIDKHREASERWLDGVAVGEKEPSGRPGEWLDESLDRTREALQHVVEMQREMITEVRSLRTATNGEAEAG